MVSNLSVDLFLGKSLFDCSKRDTFPLKKKWFSNTHLVANLAPQAPSAPVAMRKTHFAFVLDTLEKLVTDNHASHTICVAQKWVIPTNTANLLLTKTSKTGLDLVHFCIIQRTGLIITLAGYITDIFNLVDCFVYSQILFHRANATIDVGSGPAQRGTDGYYLPVQLHTFEPLFYKYTRGTRIMFNNPN